MIAVTGHFERPRVRKLSAKLILAFKKEGLEVERIEISSRRLGSTALQLVCVVGGDGSLLRVARNVSEKTALLGIAAGKRSRLMQVKPEQISKAVKQFAAGKYLIEKRARIQGKINGRKLPLALNELLVVAKKSGSLISFGLKIGKKKIIIDGDGMIVATPTGSTGHSYSAGGRKLRQSEKKFVVVPSNPIERNGKAFTVSDKSKIEIRQECKGKKTEVVVDGRKRFALKGKLAVKRGNLHR